ncbi:MAG: hypothetical protein ABSF03_21865 [Streptosporangiaceae bacterium]|jgi:hypothetical protein
MTADTSATDPAPAAVPPYRVVQWATGTIGAYALRKIIEHPDMTLAGVYVHSPAKAGKDAGDLCGVAATGVLATGDIDEILALRADCVLYMPLAGDVGELCRLLGSGGERRHHRGRVPPSGQPRPRGPRPGRGRVRARRQHDPQHREQSRVHHGGRPAGADVDPAPFRWPDDRGVRRPVGA